jgi:hypothetical protein
MVEGKPLTPLSFGSVLIVGAKASNFDDEIKTHPRVTIWDSQNEHWTNKDMPDNTRAVFMTRFIGHTASSKILSEARKRQITIFNPEGTGMIVRQVKELLNMTPQQKEQETEMPADGKGKLYPLYEFIDWSKSNIENARTLMLKAKELKIETTEMSLSQLVGVRRKKEHHTAVPRSLQGKLDVSVEILDNAIQSLKDIRDFLLSTTRENAKLREKLERFKTIISSED